MFRKRTFCAVDGEVGGGEAWNRDFRMEFYIMELISIRVWATNWKNHGIEFTNYNEGNLGRVPTTLRMRENWRGKGEGKERRKRSSIWQISGRKRIVDWPRVALFVTISRLFSPGTTN